MTKLSDLKTIVTIEPLEGRETMMVLSLNDENEIDEALHALSYFFGEDESRTSVQLEVRGNRIGYLNRREERQYRSKLWQSQIAQLPGDPPYTFINLTCPAEGCDTLILKIHYDERNPPRCPMHPDMTLRVDT